MIHLHVAPEVSSLDFADALTLQGFVIPAISTRKVESDMDLRDGQTFAIAGLMDNRVTEQLSKMPGIGDIPILGKLFQSRSMNKIDRRIVDRGHAANRAPIRCGSPYPRTGVPDSVSRTRSSQEVKRDQPGRQIAKEKTLNLVAMNRILNPGKGLSVLC